MTLRVIFTCVKATNWYIEKRENRRGEGLCIFVQDNLSIKIRDDFSDISEAVEFLSLEIENELSKKNNVNFGLKIAYCWVPNVWKTNKKYIFKNSIANKNVIWIKALQKPFKKSHNWKRTQLQNL